MCGIFCFKGENLTHNILDSLKKLEYRGYDSCGIAYLDNDIHIEKAVGCVDELRKKVKNKLVGMALSHTRWATHGEVSLRNSHPHYSEDKKVYLVHNGIIDNASSLKETYLSKVNFYGETDSEIIANLISSFLKESKPLESIKKLIDILEGTYAICFVIEGDDKIYYLKDKSPLVVGKSNHNIYISSDLYSLPNEVHSYMNIANKDFGFISDIVYCNSGERFYDFDLSFSYENKVGYKMKNEIDEEPSLVDGLVEYVNSIDEKDRCIFNAYNSLVIVGSGSSYYAGMYIKRMYEEIFGKHAYVYLASELNYRLPVIDKDSLVLLISQSGETIDIIDSCELLKDYKRVLFTNNIYSTLANQVDIVFDICAKKEYGVAATKTFNQTVLLGYLLFNGEAYEVNTYKNRLKEIVKEDINIDKLLNSKKIFYIGVGYDYIATLEGALKLKEITYVPCEGYSASELKHGTLSLIDNETTVIAISSTIKSYLLTTLAEVQSRSGNVMYIKEERSLPFLGALLLITRLQMIAYKLAIEKGLDPDHPRNLAKCVTVR